jgi:hypothetical protein
MAFVYNEEVMLRHPCACLHTLFAHVYKHLSTPYAHDIVFVEFYINWDNASQARKMGLTYKNPFDKGLRKNLRRVFGDVPWWVFE